MSKRPKHPLEDFTRDTFGEQFAAIILHGLNGEEAKDVCLSFERVDEWGATVQTTLSVAEPL
ncbi:MAG TPA: hypothetical protein VD835_10405 [Pyrinomonadaceae bacterium]|nr:hypothetical protein [Pyrinomonadaceae bacterium]